MVFQMLVVHDVILDLLISLSTEDNFVSRLDCQNFVPSTRKIRRLLLQDNQEEVIVPQTVDVSHVRSVIAFGDAFNWMPHLSRFKFLRVLDLEGFPSKNNHPRDLRHLHHLRYLQLRGYLGREVLEEIGNLQHLKMLDLSHAYVHDHELPASIIRLRNLQSLLVDVGVKMPQGIGSLSLLQEISWIEVEPNTAC
ncbi:disease resistance protein PIK6-NP-like [Miscanthus floridulus]|uniref:disease resistance protein PIK6-NP-like n=1 Tax=Miscanthus floridulus TaxID=154761 RepID=UPI00345869F4